MLMDKGISGRARKQLPQKYSKGKPGNVAGALDLIQSHICTEDHMTNKINQFPTLLPSLPVIKSTF